jgi:hypothetical protein
MHLPARYVKKLLSNLQSLDAAERISSVMIALPTKSFLAVLRVENKLLFVNRRFWTKFIER